MVVACIPLTAASAAGRVMQMMMEHQQLLAQKQQVERMLAMRDQRFGPIPTAAGATESEAAAVEGGSRLGFGAVARPSSGFVRGTNSNVGAGDGLDEFRGAF